ncbi:MAG: DNA repair protein RecN [Bacteroidales bacterium]|nr:DNA repair protein RecN [Bacteroidales bacterium]
MLERLQVRNYVLIDSLDIDFPEGLLIITGQTGAGKSILLGALNLVLGAKADASMIGEGADNCVVEAEFIVDPADEELRALLEESEAEWDGGHLIVRRVVSRSGRSRSFVNDSPVPVGVLQQAAPHMLDIHSQHQTLILTDRRFQLSILDSYAGNQALLDECSASYRERVALKSRLSAIEEQLRLLQRDRDYNQARFEKLDSAKLRDGELAALDEEQKVLANAEQVKSQLEAAMRLMEPEDDLAQPLGNTLREVGKYLSRLASIIPSASALANRIESAKLELDDIYSEIESLDSKVEVSEDRLALVEDRMGLIYGLFQKFGCRTEVELIALREELSGKLFDSTRLEQEKSELESRISAAESRLAGLSSRLHESRLKAAPDFAKDIEKGIRSLELPSAVFSVVLSETETTATGSDDVHFLFSSTGRNAVDVARCASGGEMSRIMLALKDLMARFRNMPTMIFDEIDTGVSGSVADSMGSMICSMGCRMQVFAITHLPQVAAKGSAHYVVTKSSAEDGRMVSTIKKLSPEERVLELARMLSGASLTDAAVANAKSLLGI